MKEDSRLRRQLRDDLGGLPAVPAHTEGIEKDTHKRQPDAPPFCLSSEMLNWSR
jgi:hypothetical protein